MDVDDGASGNNDDDDMDGIQNWYYKFGKIWIFVLVVASKFDVSGGGVLPQLPWQPLMLFVYRSQMSLTVYSKKRLAYAISSLSQDLLFTVSMRMIKKWKALLGDGYLPWVEMVSRMIFCGKYSFDLDSP